MDFESIGKLNQDYRNMYKLIGHENKKITYMQGYINRYNSIGHGQK